MAPGQVFFVWSASCLSFVTVAKLPRLVWCPKPALLAPRYVVCDDVGAGCCRELFCLFFVHQSWRCFLRTFIVWTPWDFFMLFEAVLWWALVHPQYLRLYQQTLVFLMLFEVFYDRILFILSTIHHYKTLVIYCRPLFIVWVLRGFWCFFGLLFFFIVGACINKLWCFRCFLRLFCGRFLFIVWVIWGCINKIRGFGCFLKLFYDRFLFIIWVIWVSINKFRGFWCIFRLAVFLAFFLAFVVVFFTPAFLGFYSSSLGSSMHSDTFLGSSD